MLESRVYEQLYEFCEMFPRAADFTAHDKTRYLALRASITSQTESRGLNFSTLGIAALLSALDVAQAQRHGSSRQVLAARGKFKREIEWLALTIETTEIVSQ